MSCVGMTEFLQQKPKSYEIPGILTLMYSAGMTEFFKQKLQSSKIINNMNNYEI